MAGGRYRKPTANPSAKIVDFRGLDSSTILILLGGIPRPIGDFPESLTQAMLVGTMLVGGLGVQQAWPQNLIRQHAQNCDERVATHARKQREGDNAKPHDLPHNHPMHGHSTIITDS